MKHLKLKLLCRKQLRGVDVLLKVRSAMVTKLSSHAFRAQRVKEARDRDKTKLANYEAENKKMQHELDEWCKWWTRVGQFLQHRWTEER